ncbi:MAG: hypothetical protein COV69_02105 [Parcubacteria group bacterium CG11_big_fil_rev_8_21_14_0_20_39_14]|nr:MAG: hypothetical protein COV69_02105 [Parcubacteria group bacterium CG11_big_fil_rev_8_21_14_0_20_39_14]
MAKKVNPIRKFLSNGAGKTIPWFVVFGIMAILAMLVLNAGQQTLPQMVQADVATTAVKVSNSAPTLSAIVEDPTSADGQGVGSTAGNPTNQGDNITWQGTASDANGDYWYLAICKENSIATNSLAAPTCSGAGAWIVTATTTSGAQQTATTSTSGVSATSSLWYAFACDYNTDQKCSAGNTGTGDAAQNSPFCTNHRPSFTEVSNTTPIDPNEIITWNSTSSDSDLFAAADTIKLYVCKTNSFTTGGSPGCDSDQTWCSTTNSSDLTCGYDDSDDIMQDKLYNAWVFMVDNHGFDATDTGAHGDTSDYTVSNVAPTVTASTIQFVDEGGDTDLDLTYPEGETANFKVNVTIIDKNSCEKSPSGSEIATNTDASVTKAWVYRSGQGASCSANANNCYLDLADCTLGPCGGASDDTVTSTCTFSMWYVADPTDSTSYYPANTWLATFKAVDDDNASSSQESSSPSEMISYIASALITNITLDYGTVGAGETSGEGTTTIKAIGNTGLDNEISGVDMESGINLIAIDQQHASTTSGFTWATGATATSTATELEINCLKTIATNTPATSSTYWLIKINTGQAAGTYEGTNTISGVISETSTW